MESRNQIRPIQWNDVNKNFTLFFKVTCLTLAFALIDLRLAQAADQDSNLAPNLDDIIIEVYQRDDENQKGEFTPVDGISKQIFELRKKELKKRRAAERKQKVINKLNKIVPSFLHVKENPVQTRQKRLLQEIADTFALIKYEESGTLSERFRAIVSVLQSIREIYKDILPEKYFDHLKESDVVPQLEQILSRLEKRRQKLKQLGKLHFRQSEIDREFNDAYAKLTQMQIDPSVKRVAEAFFRLSPDDRFHVKETSRRASAGLGIGVGVRHEHFKLINSVTGEIFWSDAMDLTIPLGLGVIYSGKGRVEVNEGLTRAQLKEWKPLRAKGEHGAVFLHGKIAGSSSLATGMETYETFRVNGRSGKFLRTHYIDSKPIGLGATWNPGVIGFLGKLPMKKRASKSIHLETLFSQLLKAN